MPADYSDIPGERTIFVLAWRIIEKHRHTPQDESHRSEWEGVAMECHDLSQCANAHGAAAAKLAESVAAGLMEYYAEKCRNLR